MNTSPSELYRQAVNNGSIQTDQGQIAALVLLDEIHTILLASPPTKAAAKWYQFWRSQPVARESVHGAYLWGGVGTGKTLIMDIFFQSLPDGFGRRIHFHRFMQSVHDQKNRIKNQQDPLAIIAKQLVVKHSVLCLDEFAVTDITDAMLLHGLLKHLFTAGMVLVTTSNTPPENLYLNGLQRARFLPAIKLLQDHTRLIHVDQGKDYRMAFLRNADMYLSPLNEATEELMRQDFLQLSGEHESSKQTLLLSGREVPVLGTGSGTVWFSCDVLCESPRSKIDYIELSKRFHTLFLSDVRTFDIYREDAARRFIELVDEIYDRGVNLILSADVLPDDLYQGKKLNDPFQRTISRLQEMQSDEYLARPHLA